MPIEVVAATVDRRADVATLLGAGDARACWCRYYRMSAGDYGRSATIDPEAWMAERLTHPPAPGVLAYLEGEPVGWCGIGPRTEMIRLQRSRTIPTIDDAPVWSIVCFKVRVGHRRQGVAHALLAGVIDYARAEGAVGLEAYPVDPEGARLDVSFAYVGTTAMFSAAGFRRVVQTTSRSASRYRWLMRLDFQTPR
jgi:GNAT superfamily N-acetyltransferase